MITINSITIEEYKELEQSIDFIPLWASSIAAEGYSNREIIVLRDKSIVKLIFVLPLYNDGNRITAEREYRVYPYASPVIFENDNLKRRKYVYEVFKYIKSKYPLIELPLHFEFKDYAAVQSLGMFIDMWHTHITYKKLESDDLTTKLRYNTSYANKRVKIKVDQNYEEFDFYQAIHGDEKEIELRKRNVINLIKNNKAIIFSAYEKETNEKIASTVISYDSKCAYYLHCYRKKESIRGVVSLMLLKAIEYSFDELKVCCFDFEGAVLQNIDKFLSTFNVDIIPYGYLYFAKDELEYMELIKSTIYIEGRLENEE